MLELTEKLDSAVSYDAVISLDYDSRKRGRLKTLTETDEEAGLFLDRGQTLMDGDYLRATDGRVALVKAAIAEPLTRGLDKGPSVVRKNLLSPREPTHAGRDSTMCGTFPAGSCVV